jgi:hypothetical protein
MTDKIVLKNEAYIGISLQPVPPLVLLYRFVSVLEKLFSHVYDMKAALTSVQIQI